MVSKILSTFVVGKYWLTIIKHYIMEENITEQSTVKNPDAPARTREEILAWLDRARKRKEQFMKETDEWFAERDRRRKELMESDYYQIEWV